MNIDDFLEELRISFMESIKADDSVYPDSVEKAYVELKRWIFSHEVVSGQKLIYQDLADRLGMSATPIIHALNRLEYEGFVSRKLNRGYFISEMDEKEMGELFDAREAIEVFSMEGFIRNLTDIKLEELYRIAKYHSQTDYDDMRKRLILDMFFHLRMTEIADNKRLDRILLGLFEHSYHACRHGKFPLSRKTDAEKEHKDILKAINDKDVAKAKRLIREHIRHGKKVMLESAETLGAYSTRFVA